MKEQARRRRARDVIALVLALAVTAMVDAPAVGADARGQVREAIEKLQDGQYQQALDGLREAEVMFPDSAELAYDRGVAQYRLREFEKAREAFSAALSTRDGSLEAKAKYNLGNCSYAEALERLTDLQGAIDKLREAIFYYRSALELNPDDQDARANIETAQLLIKDLLDKKKKEEEERQKQQQDQQNQCSQPSEGEQDEQQDQGQQQDQQGSEEKEEDKQEQGQQEQQKGQEPEQQQQQEQTARAEAGEERPMTREEADRLLQAVRDKERQRRDELQRRIPVGRAPVDKDW